MNFLGCLLEDLYDAIHRGAGNEVLTTMNINVHDPFWLTRLGEWEPWMDIVGLGAYPNYLFNRPVLGEILAASIQMAQQSTTKPVMVMETGYPSGPADRGYTGALQAEYLVRRLGPAHRTQALQATSGIDWRTL